MEVDHTTDVHRGKLALYELWRDNQDEKRATIRMRISVATRHRVA